MQQQLETLLTLFLCCRKRARMGLVENTGVRTVQSKMFVGGFTCNRKATLAVQGKSVWNTSGDVKPERVRVVSRRHVRSLLSASGPTLDLERISASRDRVLARPQPRNRHWSSHLDTHEPQFLKLRSRDIRPI
jgi:hypothetical protein